MSFDKKSYDAAENGDEKDKMISLDDHVDTGIEYRDKVSKVIIIV